jgi:hypothetical protein
MVEKWQAVSKSGSSHVGSLEEICSVLAQYINEAIPRDVQIIPSNLCEKISLALWLRHYATSRKVAGSRLDKLSIFFRFT